MYAGINSVRWKEGNTYMKKQSLQFAVQKTNNIVNRIGRSYIIHPKIKFSGGNIKWYEARLKQQYSNKDG